MNQLVTFNQTNTPRLVAAAGEKAELRFIEFFAAQIRNANTRRAYVQAVGDFLTWYERAGVASIAAVQPLHVAAYVEQLATTHIEELGGPLAAPSVKQALAAIRHLFDWLVIGQIVPVNPAASVRGPKHVVRGGKTVVLSPDEAARLIDSIDTSTPIGLRDRALISLMVYTFARIGAVVGMKVEDVYTQARRLWVLLHEKGGQEHKMPCHHNLETYLHEYIEGAGLGSNPKAPLFPTIERKGRGRGVGRLSTHPSAPGQCARHGPPAGRCRRHGNKGRQSHLPCDRHHNVSLKRRDTRECEVDGQSLIATYDTALRQPARRVDAR